MSQLRVLIVEDDPMQARLIRGLLDRASKGRIEMSRVERLDEALAQVEHRAADAVLLDLTLPDSAGLETFVRLHEAANGLPIVVLTGLDDLTIAAKAVEAGARSGTVKGLVLMSGKDKSFIVGADIREFDQLDTEARFAGRAVFRR